MKVADETLDAPKSLAGRVALVIGGGNGLGREIAIAMAKVGATVAVGDLDRASATATESMIGIDRSAGSFEVDVADHDSCFATVDRVVDRAGRLDIMVNCAALCLVDRLLEITPARWNAVFAVNALGSLLCTQAAARAMLPNGYGRIIHISTPASRLGFPLWASYGASKAAMDSLVKAAALELAPHGITVNTIVPGRMTGGMIDKLEQDVAALTGVDASQMEEERTRALPMRRRVPPAEVAEAAVWLASAAAAYVTAARINVTGGMELS